MDEKEYDAFWDKVRLEEDRKVPLTPTPKLEELRKRLVADAERREE